MSWAWKGKVRLQDTEHAAKGELKRWGSKANTIVKVLGGGGIQVESYQRANRTKEKRRGKGLMRKEDMSNV